MGVDSLGVGRASDADGVGETSDSLAIELGTVVDSGTSLDELTLEGSGRGSRLLMILPIGSVRPVLEAAVSESD